MSIKEKFSNLNEKLNQFFKRNPYKKVSLTTKLFGSLMILLIFIGLGYVVYNNAVNKNISTLTSTFTRTVFKTWDYSTISRYASGSFRQQLRWDTIHNQFDMYQKSCGFITNDYSISNKISYKLDGFKLAYSAESMNRIKCNKGALILTLSWVKAPNSDNWKISQFNLSADQL